MKKKLKRRFCCHPSSIAPVLLPFMKISGTSESIDPIDIDDGIYNFLSVSLEDDSSSSSASAGKKEGESELNGTVRDGRSPTPSSPSRLKNATKKPKSYKNVTVPEWYRKGQSLEVLLREAEQLDWSQDIERLLALQQQHSVSVSMTSQSIPEGTAESSKDSDGEEQREESKIRRKSIESLESLMQASRLEKEYQHQNKALPVSDDNLDVFFETNYFE